MMCKKQARDGPGRRARKPYLHAVHHRHQVVHQHLLLTVHVRAWVTWVTWVTWVGEM